MKTLPAFLAALSLLWVARPLLHAAVPTGNFWPNPTFEDGTDLGDPVIGKPTAWNRGGNDPSICTVSTGNAVSPGHALAVEDDNTAGYGEWYGDFPLTGLVRAGSLVNLQWSELYHVDSGEMRLTAVFLNAQGNGIGDRHFVVKNSSSGWKGDPASSTFTLRNAAIALPPGTKTLRLSLVSGGPSSTTGIYLIDDLSAVLAPTAPVTLFGNFWPNPGFELGTDLEADTGQPAGWTRTGGDPAISRVTHDNYSSSTHALALVDPGTTSGGWSAEVALGDKAREGDTLGLQWFEVVQVAAGGPMTLNADFLNAANGVVGGKVFPREGNSPGWAGDLASSSFTKRTETLSVPAGAVKLRLGLTSGPAETTGLMVIDDLSVAPPPIPPVVLAGSFWPNPGFEEGAQLSNPTAGQPTGWSRGGSDVGFDLVSSANWKSTAHALAVVDTAEEGYGEWYRNHDLVPLALAPDAVLQAQWWWVFDTVGDMRLTFLFFASDNTPLGQRDVVVHGQSPGWTGDLASSPLVRRVARLVVPEGATRLQATLASGGALTVTGTILLDDLSLRVAPADADTDGDGMTDANEDLAGTDPEDPGSSLRLLIPSVEADGVHVTWTSVPGKTYAVEFAARLTDPFVALPGAESVPAADGLDTTTQTDGRGEGAGFYRIRLSGP